MITTIIIILTALISIKAFKDIELMGKLIFHPPAVKKGSWYRLFTYGVVHADYTHLIFNMFTLYFFGIEIERVFKTVLGQTTGSFSYVLLYISALLISILPTYFKQKDNTSYYGTYQPDEFHGYHVYTNHAACLSLWFYIHINIYFTRKKTNRWYKSFCTHNWWYLRYTIYGSRFLYICRYQSGKLIYNPNKNRLNI